MGPDGRYVKGRAGHDGLTCNVHGAYTAGNQDRTILYSHILISHILISARAATRALRTSEPSLILRRHGKAEAAHSTPGVDSLPILPDSQKSKISPLRLRLGRLFFRLGGISPALKGLNVRRTRGLAERIGRFAAKSLANRGENRCVHPLRTELAGYAARSRQVTGNDMARCLCLRGRAARAGQLQFRRRFRQTPC
jgi:hypothetical protein